MKRKITLKGKNETIVIENDSMEAIIKKLIMDYSTEIDMYEPVLIITTDYIVDIDDLDDDDKMLFHECFEEYVKENEKEFSMVFWTCLVDEFRPKTYKIK